MSWIDFLDDVSANFYEKEAVIDQSSGRRLTYGQLKEEVGKWSSYFNSKGVMKGDRVAFTHTNCLEHLTLFLACSRIGAIFVPLNWRLGKAELEEILAKISPKLVLYKNECKLNLDPYQHVELNSVDISKQEIRPEIFAEIPMSQPLLMLFTSGSTGKPKGVLLHGEMLAANQRETCKGWEILSDDKTIVETPFFHTGGYNVLLLPLLSVGGTAILAEKFDLDNLYKTIQEEKITVYFGVPTMFQTINEDPRFEGADFSSIRFFVSGGAHCPVELISAYQGKGILFKQGFGLTEVGPNCFLLPEEDAVRKVGTIGKPMPHSNVLLIKDNQEVGVNEIGEIVIKGPHVCAGYFKDEELFEKSLWNGYFKTGDLATRDEEGYFTIAGRKKDMYISGGENVYPAEVERKINSHPLIHDVVVVSVPDQKWGEVGFAFIKSEKDVELTELRDFLNPLLSRYKHPQFIKNMDAFPLLDNGKIDRKKLKELAPNYTNTKR